MSEEKKNDGGPAFSGTRIVPIPFGHEKSAPNYMEEPFAGNISVRDYFAAKWIPQGWQWVDPKKEFDAMLTAIRAGLLSRSEAISAFGYDAEDIDREIAADNQRADELGLIFDSDPRHDKAPQPSASGAHINAAATVAVPQDQQDN